MTEVFDALERMGGDVGGTTAVLGILLRVTVLLAVTVLVSLGLRRSSASLRHMVWTLSLVGAMLIPPLSWALPAWQWAILPERQESPPRATETAKDAPAEAPLPSTYSTSSDATAGGPFERPAMPPPGRRPVAAAPATAIANPARNESSAARLASGSTWSCPAIFAAVWVLGICWGTLCLGVGMIGAWNVARRAKLAVDPRWHELLEELRRRCDVGCHVEVRDCPQVSVPMTWGLWRPVILVPAGSAAWSEATRRSVLLHELGHIRRGDCIVHLLGRLACVVYWFHPLVWLAARQLRKTSEQAADDMVLSSNIARCDYAEHLVAIAAQVRSLRLSSYVALPMASTSDLEGRVLAILDPGRNHRSLKRKAYYGVLILAAAVLVSCASLRLGHAQNTHPEEQAGVTKSLDRDDAATPSDPDTAVANEKQPAEQSNEPAEATIDVLVVTPDGHPVVDAEVLALNKVVAFERHMYRTGKNGRVSIAREKPVLNNVFSLVARHGETFGWRGSQRGPSIAEEAVKQPIKITLYPRSQTIEGTCVDAKGQPLAGVRVCVAGLTNPANGGLLVYGLQDDVLGATVSDTEGHYSTKLPEFELCRIVAEHPGFVVVEHSFGTSSKPGILVLSEPAGTIRGRVVDAASGAAIQGAVIGAQSLIPHTGGRGFRLTVSDEDGEYALGSIAPGFWNVLFMQLPGKPTWSAVATNSLEVKAGDTATADFHVIPGRRLSGEVIDAETGAPLAGVSVGYYGSARPRSGAACVMVKTDSQGQFEFHVPPGESYVYVAETFDGNPKSRMMIVEPDRDPSPLVFKGALKKSRGLDGARAKPAAVRVEDSVAVTEEEERITSGADSAYTLRGTLRTPEGKPVPSATIQLWSPGRSHVGEARYQETQRFLAHGGDFRQFLGIRFFDKQGRRQLELEDQYYQNKAGKPRYLVIDAPGYARPQPIEFTFAKQIKPITVVLERPTLVSVRGCVLDDRGQPVADANVSVSLSTVGDAVEEPWGPEYLTDNEGRFEVKHVHVGNRFAVRIEKDRCLPATSPWTVVKNADPIDLGDLRLKPAEQSQASRKAPPAATAASPPAEPAKAIAGTGATVPISEETTPAQIHKEHPPAAVFNGITTDAPKLTAEKNRLAIEVTILGVDAKPIDQYSTVTVWEEVDAASQVGARDYTWADPRDGTAWRRVSGSHPKKDYFLTQNTLQPGMYRVTAFVGSHEKKMIGMAVSGRIRLDGSQETTPVTISVEEGPAVTFTVVDVKTGNPVDYPQPGIHLTRSDGLDVERDPLNENVFPDDTGKYHIEHLAPGTYQLDVSTRASSYGYPVYRTRQPIRINVSAGERNDFVVKVSAQPIDEAEARKRWPWAVDGVVMDGDGRPLEGVEIRAACGWGTIGNTMPVVTDTRGQYLLRFGPGLIIMNQRTGRWGASVQAAIISVRKRGYAEKNLGRQGDLLMADEMPEEASRWDRKKIVLPDKPYRVDFVMVPAAMIQGRLLNEKGEPLANKEIILDGDELPPGSSILQAATTDADGGFLFDRVPSGFAWWLELGSAKDFALPRIRPIRLRECETREVVLRITSHEGSGKMLRIGSINDSQRHDARNVVGDGAPPHSSTGRAPGDTNH